MLGTHSILTFISNKNSSFSCYLFQHVQVSHVRVLFHSHCYNTS